jgi:nucleoside-diphosphate-sugar epimerase
MKLLISGASGYIGSHLLKKIDSKKYELCLLVRKQMNDIPVNSVVVDTTKSGWKKQVHSFNPEIVLHLASHLTSSDDESQIDKLIDANISFGTHLLDALKATGVKVFINTGTFAEYHMRDGKRTPAYLYAATKTAFCSIVNYYQAVIGYRVFNIIPYTVYGGTHSAKKLIDYIFESLDESNTVKMSPGEQVLDFIHIDDVVDFYRTLLSNLGNFKNNYSEIHIGSGEGITPKKITALMETITGKKANVNWGGLPYRPNDTMFSVAPKELSGQQIGWEPSLNIEEGIRLYIKEKQ